MKPYFRWAKLTIGGIFSLTILVIWMALVVEASYRFWLLYFPVGCVMMTIFGCCLGWGMHSIFDEEKLFEQYQALAFIISWLLFSSAMCALAMFLSKDFAQQAGLISEFTKEGFWHAAVIFRWIIWSLCFILAYPYCGLVTYRKEKLRH